VQSIFKALSSRFPERAFHRHNLAQAPEGPFSLVVMYASRFRKCVCAERNRIGGAREKRGGQRPRATLRWEVHATQEVLDARGGAQQVRREAVQVKADGRMPARHSSLFSIVLQQPHVAISGTRPHRQVTTVWGGYTPTLPNDSRERLLPDGLTVAIQVHVEELGPNTFNGRDKQAPAVRCPEHAREAFPTFDIELANLPASQRQDLDLDSALALVPLCNCEMRTIKG